MTAAVDLRTNQHFALKQNPLRRRHLDDLVAVYKPDAHRKREESERFKRFTYDELRGRDNVSLDITWLRGESLETSTTPHRQKRLPRRFSKIWRLRERSSQRSRQTTK